MFRRIKTWYWIDNANQPGRDLIRLDQPPDPVALPKAQAALINVRSNMDSDARDLG